jgi:hypothetical protein
MPRDSAVFKQHVRVLVVRPGTKPQTLQAFPQ